MQSSQAARRLYESILSTIQFPENRESFFAYASDDLAAMPKVQPASVIERLHCAADFAEAQNPSPHGAIEWWSTMEWTTEESHAVWAATA